ncbi:MAG: cystathionine beta-lyase [Geminicoccaceae bacterium]|nr:cystathionine beta-lyase [Geminicoccaceae bacterium]
MRERTKLVTLGRDPERYQGLVSTPICRTSTVIFPTLAAQRNARAHDDLTYGTHGTQTKFAFEEAIAELENGYRSIAVSSGLAAITLPLAGLLSAGDHVLVTDSAYFPTRRFCDAELSRYGVETTYYDPAIGAGIEELVRDNTRLILLEAPGSLTFEMQDIPAMADVARRRGVITLMDNTWATPLYFKPLDHGVDISIHAVTKYIGGHSDILMGVITTTKELHDRIRERISHFGDTVSPEDLFLAMRGMRSMAARLDRQQQSALEVAGWLAGQPAVDRVLYPPLPSDPGHALWKRDMSGGSSLFGVVLGEGSQTAVEAMVDNLELFGIGASWGGFESLVTAPDPGRFRTATPWHGPGPLLRLHVGLEDSADLIDDLAAGLERYSRTD